MPAGHVDETKPLKPLSEHAWAVLEKLKHDSQRAYRINPGIRDRLRRGGLVVEFYHHKLGRMVEITDAGRAALVGDSKLTRDA